MNLDEQQSIDYKKIMQTASLNSIKALLQQVSLDGLPGQHHFYITFDTSNPEVELSLALKERYQSEMTIVIQNWYQDLRVEENAFYITLNFSNVPEKMKIPFDALRSFVDPHVEFAIEFEDLSVNKEPTTANLVDTESKKLDNEDESILDTQKAPKRGEVVNIENFRKS